MKNIAIIGGGPSALILIKSLQTKLSQTRTPKPSLHISLYEQSPRLLDFFYKYFSKDSNSISLDTVLLKELKDTKINLNTEITPDTFKNILRENKFTDVVFALGMKEKEYGDLQIPINKSLETIKRLNEGNNEGFKDAIVAIIGCGNVSMDLTRNLLKNGARKIYSFCRGDWKTAKFTNAELKKTVEAANNSFSTKNFLNKKCEILNEQTKRRSKFLNKFPEFNEKEDKKFSILFDTSIKALKKTEENKILIETNGKEKIKVNEIISAVGFQSVDIQPYVNIIESMTSKPFIHLLGGNRIDEISRKADYLSEKLLSLSPRVFTKALSN